MGECGIAAIAAMLIGGGILALIAVICTSAQVKPTIGGVYETKTGNIRVTVIGYSYDIVRYEFKDPESYGRLQEGSMKLSEFNRIFVYLYTDYKTLVYKINKKH